MLVVRGGGSRLARAVHLSREGKRGGSGLVGEEGVLEGVVEGWRGPYTCRERVREGW